MPFTKGQSVYPDGRKVEAQVKRAARAEAPKSIAALALIRDDPSAPVDLRGRAALELLALGRFKSAPTLAVV